MCNPICYGRKNAGCKGTEYMPCETFKVLPVGKYRSRDSLECTINATVHNDCPYSFNITGENPYKRIKRVIETTLDNSISKFPFY